MEPPVKTPATSPAEHKMKTQINSDITGADLSISDDAASAVVRPNPFQGLLCIIFPAAGEE